MMKCNFLGIGVQKAASTWVYKVLEDHPEIKVSFPKELDYFSRDHNFKKGDSWYHSHFDFESPENKNKFFGEISPSYFDNESAIQRAQEYNSNLKIIVTLRDPVERAYSNHLHMIRRNKLGDDLSFESGMKMFPQYVSQSRYYSHLKKWFAAFPADQIIVLFQEDIKQNPEQEAKKLYEFLSINSSHASQFLHKKANVSYSVKYKKLESLLRFFSNLFIRLGMRGFVKFVKRNPLVISLREKKAKHLTDEIPEMKPETKEMLMDELSDEMINLSALLKVDSFPWPTWAFIESKRYLEGEKG